MAKQNDNASGIHMDLRDGDRTRFEVLKQTHPQLWNYVREHIPMPSLAKRIRWGEDA